MLEATDAIVTYTSRGKHVFDNDPAVREAILYQIVVLGEAAKAVVKADPELANELSQVEWSPLARMRDRFTHQYWAIEFPEAALGAKNFNNGANHGRASRKIGCHHLLLRGEFVVESLL